MRFIYFLSSSGCQHGVVRKRTSDRHHYTYHGVGKFLQKELVSKPGPKWVRPTLSNSNRERLHITRSGDFVPHVCSPANGTLGVSDEVRRKLSGLPGLEFLPVVFERLVKLKLPALGDIIEDELLASVQMLEFMNSLPDEPGYHASIGEYFHVLCPNYFEVKESVSDATEIDVMWGRYNTIHPRDKAPFSAQLLHQNAMYNERSYYVLSEECFRILAPYIDLDYFYIDYYSLTPTIKFSAD